MYQIDEVTQAPRVSEELVRQIVKDAWGILDADVQLLNGYEDMNFRLTNIIWEENVHSDRIAIFKITNPVAARNTKHLDFQKKVCDVLNGDRIPAPEYIPLKGSEKIWRIEKITDQVSLPVRLIRVLPGINLEYFPYDEQILFSVGKIVAEFHNSVDKISKSELISHIPFMGAENVNGSMKEVKVLRRMGLLNDSQVSRLNKVFTELKKMLTNRGNMDCGLIHSDINDTNILVNPTDSGLEISGLIDMGDVHESLRIMDIGATCLYLVLSDKNEEDDWLRIPRRVLSGYCSVRKSADRQFLFAAMRARMACSLVCGLRAARINYRNEHDPYVLKTQIRGWNVLEKLMSLSSDDLAM